MNSSLSDKTILDSALRSLFDMSHALVCLRDAQGRFVKVSEAVAARYDVAPEKMIGRGLLDLFGQQVARAVESDRSIIESGMPASKSAEPLPRKDGGIFWAEVSKTPVSDEEGTVIAVLVFAGEITEAQGTEAQVTEAPIAERCDLLETVVNSVDAPIAFYGADSCLVFGNHAYWDLHNSMGTRDVVRIGARFEDITRATCERAVECETEAERDALIDRFLEDFRNPESDTIAKQDQRWFRHNRYRTPCGGRVTFAFDITETKNAELEVAESRTLLETVVENISEMLALYGPDRRLKFGNSTYWKFHEEAGTADVVRIGATIEENVRAMVGRLSERNPHYDAEAVVSDVIWERDDKSEEFEFRWGKRDVRLRRYPTPEGGFVFFGYDVTERKKAEAALETSNARLRDYAESASDWFWEMDADLRFTWISARYADAMGQGAEQMYGRKRSDLIDTTIDPEAWSAHLEALRRRRPFKDFVYRRHPASLPEDNPQAMWARTSGVPVFSGDGRFCGYRGTSSNVTKEKLAEQDLRESERRYQTLAETAPVGIFRTSAEGFCTYHNEVWSKIAGVERSPDMGRHWTDVFERGDRKRIGSAWREIALREGVYRTEARIDDGGGDTWVLATIALEKSQDGAPSSFIGTLTDVSLLKTVEAQLRTTQDALREHRDELEVLVERRTEALREAQRSLIAKERLSAIGQLTATVSHELRNPLGTISASFAALKRRVDLPNEKALSIAARIERNIIRCETIIRDLLNYTRIGALNRETLDFDSWMTRLLGEQDLPKELEIDVLLDARAKVSIDRSRMAQAFTNIISNASDAMADLEASERKLEIETVRRDHACVVMVRDNGPGIPPDDLERVFEPLVSTKAFGIGLGLPLVRQVVELHGGTVEILNLKDRGCEVVVSLPLHEESRRRAWRDPVPARDDLGGRAP